MAICAQMLQQQRTLDDAIAVFLGKMGATTEVVFGCTAISQHQKTQPKGILAVRALWSRNTSLQTDCNGASE